MNNKFNNKEEYLAYRSNWKASYKELSQTIRDYRWIFNEYNRTKMKIEKEVDKDICQVSNSRWSIVYKRTQEALKENKRYQELLNGKFKSYVSINKLKKNATDMLAELKEAKVEAQRQYLAQKNQLTTV